MDEHARAKSMGHSDEKETNASTCISNVSTLCRVYLSSYLSILLCVCPGEAEMPQGNSPVVARIGMATPEWQPHTHEPKFRTVRGV